MNARRSQCWIFLETGAKVNPEITAIRYQTMNLLSIECGLIPGGSIKESSLESRSS
jgi:hypothetical protein